MSRILTITLGVVSALLLGACATPGFAPQMKMSDAEINPESVTGHALRWLPSPNQSITVAVYGIADETGAFKPNDGGQTLSRAVTQAPTPILIKALHDAGNRSWFDVIERENLGNLIKERQIVQEMRARYLGETELNRDALPALKFAGVLIEGAITGYDTNTRTGGAGARYLGIGGSTQYREDSVSVYLRAVSVKTGEVLMSITSQQRVASIALQGDAFRFVSFQRLLEAEAGITLNQPRHMAVRQALEKAVYGLIVEGAEFGLWGFEDETAGVAAIEHYRENYAPHAPASNDGRLPAEFYQAHHDRDARRRAQYALARHVSAEPRRTEARAEPRAPVAATRQARNVTSGRVVRRGTPAPVSGDVDTSLLSPLDQQSLLARSHMYPNVPLVEAESPEITDVRMAKSKSGDVLASAGVRPDELAGANSPAAAANMVLLHSSGGQ